MLYRVKILALILGCTLALSLCACGGEKTQNTDNAQAQNADSAQAAEVPAEESPEQGADVVTTENGGAVAEGRSETYDEIGITINYTEEFADMKGYLIADPSGEVSRGLNLMMFYYLAMPEEEYLAAEQKARQEELSDEELALIRSKATTMLYVFSIDKGRGVEDIQNEAGATGLDQEMFTKIGEAGDINFFILDPGVDSFDWENVEEEYAEEYVILHDALIEALNNAEFFAPVVPGSEYIGQKISFETTDVDGNPVNSEELFAQNKLTMINVWATWCNPCKGELSGLAEINRKYADKGFAIVGLCSDADEALEECKSLIAENNVDYLNLLPFEGFREMIPVLCYPISYFVDSEGTIVAAPVIGASADIAQYEDYINELLKEE